MSDARLSEDGRHVQQDYDWDYDYDYRAEADNVAP